MPCLPRRSPKLPLLCLLVVGTLVACGDGAEDTPAIPTPPTYARQALQKLDLLFVVDNGLGMAAQQAKLVTAFPRLLDALSGAGEQGADTDLRIGVISTDLGAGNYNLPGCEQPGGDQGQLQNSPRTSSTCVVPSDPWISLSAGVTNVPGSGDARKRVEAAFSCIAQLGEKGCKFGNVLEATRRALDPTLNTNPGFRRSDADLALVFLANEDDCSVNNPQLFDPSHCGLTDPLGPLTTFRCFEWAVECQCTDPSSDCHRFIPGKRVNCQPRKKYNYMRKLDEFIKFFNALQKGRDTELRLLGLAGTTGDITVNVTKVNDASLPSLASSCGGGVTVTPAIRLERLVHAFARQMSEGEALDAVDKTGIDGGWLDANKARRVQNLHSMCQSDFSASLRWLVNDLSWRQTNKHP